MLVDYRKTLSEKSLEKGLTEKVYERRSNEEGSREKVYQRRSVQEGPWEKKVQWKRSIGKRALDVNSTFKIKNPNFKVLFKNMFKLVREGRG